MSQTPFEPGSTPSGAARVAGSPPSRRTWLLPLLLGLPALIALLLLLSRCGGDDPRPAATPLPSATPSTPSVSASGSSATVTPSATASVSVAGSTGTSAGAPGGEAGTVVAGGDVVLGAGPPRRLADHHDQQAVGRAVRVQSVPADEGFWVGASPTDRIWVQLTGTRGESDYEVRQGDTIDFTGTVTQAAAGFAADVGVTAAEGAAQLAEQGHYVAVPSSAVKLAG